MTATDRSQHLRHLLHEGTAESPSALLWQHFNIDDPWRLAQLTVDYFQRYEMCAAKVMPDIPILFEEGSLTSWRQLAQLRHLGDITVTGRASEYIDTVRIVRSMLNKRDPLLVTIFSPLTMVGLWCGGDDAIREMSRAPKAEVHAVLAALAQVAGQLSAACVKAGADIIYLGCHGQDALSVSEYGEYGTPYDLAVLHAARDAEFRFLHVHGRAVGGLDRYAAYPVDVVGWSEAESGISLADGANVLTGKTVMGGIPETMGLTTGERIEKARQNRIAASKALDSRFIFGPGCSLPSSLDSKEIALLRSLADGWQGFEG